MSDTILVVDDEPGILRTLSGVLKDAGFSVLIAQDGPEALRLLRQDIPRLILLDIWMPEQDGLETLKKIKELYPQMLVVMMSGHGSIETAVSGGRSKDSWSRRLESRALLACVYHCHQRRVVLDKAVAQSRRVNGCDHQHKEKSDQFFHREISWTE